MTIVLGTAIICAAALIFTVLAVLCRGPKPPALLRRDMLQTLSLLVLMAIVAGGIGVFAAGLNQAPGTLELLLAGLIVAATLAAVVVLAPWNRFAVTAASAPTDFKPPVGPSKPA